MHNEFFPKLIIIEPNGIYDLYVMHENGIFETENLFEVEKKNVIMHSRVKIEN